jgi:predicted GTPase
LVVANKVDLMPNGSEASHSLSEAIKKEVLPISAVAGTGLPALTEKLWAMVRKVKEPPRVKQALPHPPHLEAKQ